MFHDKTELDDLGDDAFLPEDMLGNDDMGDNISPEIRALMAKYEY